MSKIYKINPMSKRHNKNARDLLRCTCDVIQKLENRVSGFAVIAWQDDGYCDLYTKSGGIVNRDVLGTYVRQRIGDA